MKLIALSAVQDDVADAWINKNRKIPFNLKMPCTINTITFWPQPATFSAFLFFSLLFFCSFDGISRGLNLQVSVALFVVKAINDSRRK